MSPRTRFALVVLIGLLVDVSRGGIIKDIFQKVTNTNNKTLDVVKQTSPFCGLGAFSTPDEHSLSPQMIFITNRASHIIGEHGSGGSHDSHNPHGFSGPHGSHGSHDSHGSHGSHDSYDSHDSHGSYGSHGSHGSHDGGQHGDHWQREDHHRRDKNQRDKRAAKLAEVAREFMFHAENVSMSELEQHGFRRDAPVSFLIHGFTSGYPLQAWISAIVEAYTIDRSSSLHSHESQQSGQHNLFIVNWNYAARGILYPRAVANIPIVASYVTRFINDKLLGEAGIDAERVQLIGHSLGAHLAGFVGKNTRQKLGRIYGLDPAGPCFGSFTGPLYPSSKRLAPSDAREVITVHTNSAMLGIDKPLGRYSIFVEGGADQPGCKHEGGFIKSIQTLTFDGGDFDSLACSHSRAPNLLTYRHEQGDRDDDCQLVAYGCDSWNSFLEGKCGVCHGEQASGGGGAAEESGALKSVPCRRIGLDWQYYKSKQNPSTHDHHSSGFSSQRPHSSSHSNPYNDTHSLGSSSHGHSHNGHNSQSGYGSHNNHGSNNNYDSHNYGHDSYTNNPHRDHSYSNHTSSSHNSHSHNDPLGLNGRENSQSNWNNYSNNNQRERNKRAPESDSERRDEKVEPIIMFMRTGDTQPYCTFHYQLVLELKEPFSGRGKPPMSIILQDSVGAKRSEQNSLTNDDFGNKVNDRTYSHLLTSGKKLKRVDQATLIFRNGLKQGQQIFKQLRVNYMSHGNPEVRRRLSSRLCPVTTENDRPSTLSNSQSRFYFKPCSQSGSSNYGSSGSSNNYGSNGFQSGHKDHDNYSHENNQYNQHNQNSHNSYDSHSGSHNNHNHGGNSGFANSHNNDYGGTQNGNHDGVIGNNHGSSNSNSGRNNNYGLLNDQRPPYSNSNDNYGSSSSDNYNKRRENQPSI